MTPSQFYRNRRPEYFSDSKVVAKVVLTREQLDYEISQISITQKQDSFENLCRKFAEKLISPNLIPQVGPTGGGDGKTDTETYPVSNFISDRWFISNNKWAENENWAFAISAKKNWKEKVKLDVKKIIETNRGYTKIYFFSNQKISSRNKKETQDYIKKEHNIELIILDAEWIIEKVYSNNLLNDVIESLNLSRIYLEEKNIGPNDSERMLKLADLEGKISSIDRAYEVDFQLVEDCLDSAITSRMLELPKTEVLGKFERVKRFANKINNVQLTIRYHYQLAWTLINWYDDYKEFYTEFVLLKELVDKEPNFNNIGLCFNLFNILMAISNLEDIENYLKIDFAVEEKAFISLLEKCKLYENKPTTSIISNFYQTFIDITKNLSNEEIISENLKKLKVFFEKSKSYLDIPFEQLKELVQVYDKMLPNNKNYDDLLDVIAEIESERVSELSSAKIYLDRGITKLENDYNRESLIYFGKSARKLAKEETLVEFYYCLMLLSKAYSKLHLYWASYNALVSAANIYATKLFNKGKIDIKLLKTIEEILENEAIIGRLPIFLCWLELFNILKKQFQNGILNDTKSISTEYFVDACLAVRLLNEPFEKFNKFICLPEILNQNELYLSNDAVLYLLGHEDLIEETDEFRKETFSEYFNLLANQPFAEQIAYKTNLLDIEVG